MIMMMINKIYCADLFDLISEFPDKSVDLFLLDPPYGITAAKWDELLDFELLWKHIKRIRKHSAPTVIFSSGKFTPLIQMSNIKEYKYNWIWDKQRGTGHLSSKYRPMQQTEDINVFGKTVTYYPIPGEPYKNGGRHIYENFRSELYYASTNEEYTGEVKTHRQPTNLLSFPKESVRLHPSQKPVELLEYLIKTYTKENDLIVDLAMGVGSTCVAAKKNNRNYIGIEKAELYYDIARLRLAKI